jgi:hypothetical protein
MTRHSTCSSGITVTRDCRRRQLLNAQSDARLAANAILR